MTEEIVYHKEMGITHQAYFRTIPNAVEGRPYVIDGLRIEISGDSGPDGAPQTIVIELGLQQIRRIASVRLPVTHVTYRLSGFTQTQADAVIERFDLYYRRGGG